MKYAKIEISKKRWEMREKSVPIVIFTRWVNREDELVYAPKSRIIIEKEFKKELCTTPYMHILVPVWVFSKNCVNYWDADTFIEVVER